MSGPVQGQLVVADSGVNFVSLLQGVIRICTSDGASLTAIRFLDAFGARFPVDPRRASHIREGCSDFRHTILGELKVAVGYQKNDLSTILAESSGGLSAIAFVIAVTEIMDTEQLIWAITEMAIPWLPAETLLPTSTELEICLSAIWVRCDSYDFCFQYADMVSKIRISYFNQGESCVAPDRLTRMPNLGLFIQLLRDILSCSQSCSQIPGSQLVIQGENGIGWIAAAATWWLGQSVEVIVEDSVICEGVGPWPVCKVHVLKGKEIEWWHERKIESLSSLLPTTPITISGPDIGLQDATPTNWRDWSMTHPVINCVPGTFQTLGFPPGPALSNASRLVATLVSQVMHDSRIRHHLNSATKSLKEFLAPEPVASLYISRSLQITCGHHPTTASPREQPTFKELFNQLETVVACHVSGIIPTSCSCGSCAKNEFRISPRSSDCHLRRFRVFLMEIVVKTLGLVFVDVAPDYPFRVSMTAQNVDIEPVLDEIGKLWSSLRGRASRFEVSTNQLFDCIVAAMAPYDIDTANSGSVLGCSRFGTCIYLPAAFWPNMKQGQLTRIKVARGAFIYQDRYYLNLLVERDFGMVIPAASRTNLDNSLQLKRGFQFPSRNIGKAWKVNISIREHLQDLRVTLTVRDKQDVGRSINLVNAVYSAALATNLGECPCPRRQNAVVDTEEGVLVACTTVSRPLNNQARVSLLLAHLDHESCMYACDVSANILILRGGCLNCGIKVALKERAMLIDGFSN